MKTEPCRRVWRLCLAVGCGAVAASTAGAQSLNTFFFEVSNVITPEQPSATVTLWAAFEPQWYAFAKSQGLTVASKAGQGEFSAPHILLFQKIYCDPGKVSPDGDRVEQIRLLQWHLLFAELADTRNPIDAWSATWTTDDFTPRQVPLWTESPEYFVYIDKIGHWEDFYGVDFSEGAGFITVVPAPGALALLPGIALIALRQHRRDRAPGGLPASSTGDPATPAARCAPHR